MEEANNSLDQAISEGNMNKIKIMREMIVVANKKSPPFLAIWNNRERSGMKSKKKTKKKQTYIKAITKSRKSYKLYL